MTSLTLWIFGGLMVALTGALFASRGAPLFGSLVACAGALIVALAIDRAVQR